MLLSEAVRGQRYQRSHAWAATAAPFGGDEIAFARYSTP